MSKGIIPWAEIGAEEEKHAGSDHVETELTGLYYINAEFDEPGTWGFGVSIGEKLDEKSEVRITFSVKPVSDAPAIGQKVVPIDNPTANQKPLKEIHTGSDQDPQFHTLSVRNAIASGKPSVIAVATTIVLSDPDVRPRLAGSHQGSSEVRGTREFPPSRTISA